MSKRIMLLAGFLALVNLEPPAPVMAQSRITGPVLGYFFDEAAGGLRAINGIPGASTVGAQLDLHVKLSKAEISPTGDFAIGIDAENGQPILVRLGAGSAEIQPMEACTPGADRIVISQSGSSAALYNLGLQVIEVVSGLPSAAQPAIRLNVQGLPSPLGPIAIGDDGGVVLVTAHEAAGDAVYAIHSGPDFMDLESYGESRRMLLPMQMRDIPHAEPRDSGLLKFYSYRDRGRLLERNIPGIPIFTGFFGRVTSIVFVSQTAGALVTDIEKNQVVLVQDSAGASSVQVLADGNEGIAKPVAVATDKDSGYIYVANSESRIVTEHDGEGRNIGSFYCHASPAMLQRLGGQSVFRVTDPGKLPMLILDGRSNNPRLYFVPAARP